MSVITFLLCLMLIVMIGFQIYTIILLGTLFHETGFSNQILISKYLGDLLLNGAYMIIVGILVQIFAVLSK